MPGLGAWSYGAYYLDMPVVDHRVARGIVAFKHELAYNGLGKGMLLDLEEFGPQADSRTRDAQTLFGITVDGVIGPITARCLFRSRCRAIEVGYGIPDSYLARIKSLESNNDPVAQGYVDPSDEGLVEIHMPYWPDFTLEDAWTPSTVLDAAGSKLRSLRTTCGSFKAAVAAWNIGPSYATQWRLAGYPPLGGPIMGTDSQGRPIYAYERATNYYRLVAAAAI